MLRAEEILPAGGWTGEPADSVVLDFDERYGRGGAMTGVGGLAFELELPKAAMLRGGDGLKLGDGRIVEVVAAPEPLYEIRATDPLVLLRVALSLGNFHAPAEVTPRALRVRRDPDARAARRGALLPFGGPEGGYKGFGLALAMDALGALAAGARAADDVSGYMFIAFRPDLFLPPEDYRREVTKRIETIKATPRREGVEEIRIPGERAYKTRARLRLEGIEIDRKIHTALGRLADGKLDHGG